MNITFDSRNGSLHVTGSTWWCLAPLVSFLFRPTADFENRKNDEDEDQRQVDRAEHTMG